MPVETRLGVYGLVSVELPSSVDEEAVRDRPNLWLKALKKSRSWLRALNKELDLGGDLLRRGEPYGEDSVDDAVSLSQAPCLCM